MKTRLFALLLTLCCLIPCQRLSAQDTPPESLLPVDTVFFLRLASWNDLRQTANDTALGEVMRGDMGNFLRSITDWGWTGAREGLKQSVPDEPRRLDAFWANLEKSGQQILRHGALLGVQCDAKGESPLFMFVFPSGSKDGAVGAVQKFLEDSVSPDSGRRSPPEKVCIGLNGQTVSVVEFGGHGAWGWWSEEGHFVVAAMSGSGEELAQRLSCMAIYRDFGADDLTGNEFYRKLAASQNYATLLSGFVDIASIRGPRGPEKDEDEQMFLLEDWGMCDVQGLTFSCGFQGKAWRESYALHLDPRRRGLWQILNAAESVNLEQLPAMPADATNIFIGAFDAGRLVDLAGKTIDAVEQANHGDKELEARTAFTKGMVKQVVEQFGPQVVWFNSPCEGAFLIDQAVAIQVKDASALKALVWLAYAGQQVKGMFSGGDDSQDVLTSLALKKHTYRGVQYWTMAYPMSGTRNYLGRSSSDDSGLTLAFVIHDGWLVMGCQPQIVQGYILRTRKEAPCWEPSTELRDALRSAHRDGNNILQKGARKGRILAVSQIDTRELTRVGLSWAPWMSMYAEAVGISFETAGLPPLDATTIPNTHTVLGPLFPNVNMFIDDDEALRWEKHASLPIGIVVPAYAAATAYYMLTENQTIPNLSVWIPEPRPTVSAQAAPPPPGSRWGSEPKAPPPPPIPQNAQQPPPSGSGWGSEPKATTPTNPGSLGYYQTPGYNPAPSQLPLQPMSNTQPIGASPKSETMVVKVYDVTGLLDVKNLERSKTELQNALYLVAPKDWDEGREAGSLPIVFLTSQERVIVRQTPQAHQRIEALLTELKTSLAKQVTPTYNPGSTWPGGYSR